MESGACSRSSISKLIESIRSLYVTNLQTTLASELGGAMAVPRQPVHVYFLLAGLADHLSRGVDEHRQATRTAT